MAAFRGLSIEGEDDDEFEIVRTNSEPHHEVARADRYIFERSWHRNRGPSSSKLTLALPLSLPSLFFHSNLCAQSPKRWMGAKRI